MNRILPAIVVWLALAGLAAAQSTSAMFTGFRANSNEPINVDAESLEIAEVEGQRVSTFTGGVVIRRGDTTVKAATVKLIEDLKPKGKKAAKGEGAAGEAAKPKPSRNPFSRIEATGGVTVSSGAQSVSGDTAVFNTAANTIVLSGNVVLQQGANRIRGDRLTVDLASGIARVEQKGGGGRIKGTFSPGSMPMLDKPGRESGDGAAGSKTPVPLPKPDG